MAKVKSTVPILHARITHVEWKDDVTETKHGEWTEKEVIHAEEAKTVIEEWQSCRCSVCGRYDTRPYMYYFDNPNYCSWCGAKMAKGEENDT